MARKGHGNDAPLRGCPNLRTPYIHGMMRNVAKTTGSFWLQSHSNVNTSRSTLCSEPAPSCALPQFDP
eukprot:scaffold17667_cov216-Amphora_coffeaeformis.AAC.2